jgi:hypothetical protein
MEILDANTRQLFVRLIAKRREYVIKKLIEAYPAKKSQLEKQLKEALDHDRLEPRVKGNGA